MKFNKSFFQHIVFNELIDKKIKKQSINGYLKDFFQLKIILTKIVTLIFFVLLCGLLFFLIRKNMLSNADAKLEFNAGVAFSFGNDLSPATIYAIKSLICFPFFFIFLFCNKWYLTIPSFVIFINGLFNIIDKAIVDKFNDHNYINTVVDYIYFNGPLSSVANVADVFITVAMILMILGIIYYIYSNYKKDKSKEKSDEKLKSQE